MFLCGAKTRWFSAKPRVAKEQPLVFFWDNYIVSEGLNNGILYLMAIPYVLLLTLGWVFFRQKIKAFLGFTK
jgi:hypothetical protein